MTHFSWNPERRGLKFWLPAVAAPHILLAAGTAWAANHGAGPAIQSDLGLPSETVVAALAVLGITQGTIVGLLNRWIASRLAAAIVGAASLVPTAAMITTLQLQSAGKFSLQNGMIATLVLSAIVGGVCGAAWYEK